MNTNIISVKYEDRFMPKTFNSKAYSYITRVNVEIGDLVIAPTAYGENCKSFRNWYTRNQNRKYKTVFENNYLQNK